MSFNTKTLSSGIRLLHHQSPSQVVYCGIAVAAGTRHEHDGEHGLAHFCEHMSFKGTDRRSSVKIINQIEGVGGELNAFTNKEDTVYYCTILAEHFPRAVDVLCDIVFRSTFPLAEMEKEKEVVCEEIESYEDTPSELIFDEIDNLLFPGSALGHNILGTKEQVRSFSRDALLSFCRRYYRPANTVFFVSGDISFARAEQLVERATAMLAPEGESPREEPQLMVSTGSDNAPQRVVRNRGTHQAHVVMGTRAFALSDSRRWPLYLLNNILGGPGLNARLSLSLREKHGLVYTVESSMVSYKDTGSFCIYFGCDGSDTDRCLRLVRRELDKLMARPMSLRALNAAKRQLRSQLAIAAESREQLLVDTARNFLHLGVTRSLYDIYDNIDALTPLDLQQTACQLFRKEAFTTLIYGEK